MVAYNAYLSYRLEISNLKLINVEQRVVVQDATIKRLDKQVEIEVDTALNFRLGSGLVLDQAKQIETDRKTQIETIRQDTTRTQTEREQAIARVEVRSLWDSYCLAALDTTCTEP